MSGIIDCEMHIGDEVFVHGYIDEIRNDTIIIRNVGGYFGTSRDEVFYYEEDERGYGTMNEADRKTEPKTQTKTQNSNLTFEKDECAKEYEELGLKELKELIEADRKTESNSEKPNNCEDEPTISKMEQVEDETRLTAKCLNCANGSSYKCSKCDGEMYYKYDKDEPQIFICPIQNDYEALIEDEPQTDCPWMKGE